MEFRTLNNRDIPQIALWNVALHVDEGSVPMSVPDAEARLRSWMATGKFSGSIFSLDGQAFGYILYEHLAANPDMRGSTDSVYVRHFYVLPEYRRQGIGTDVFRRFQEEMGETKMTLDVKVTNPAGQKFW
ncbi:MAG: N-acetyltransferase, partial [Pseudomonadota bacterium]